MNKNIQTVKLIKTLLFWPFMLSMLMSLIVMWAVDGFAAKSVLMAALAVILPQLIFGFYCFRFFGALKSQEIWKSFIRGEVYKLALSAFICFLAFHCEWVNAMWFILTFILMQLLCNIINCWLLSR